MKPLLEARENGLNSSSIKYRFKQSHQTNLAELSCWRSLENLMEVKPLKSSAVSWKGTACLKECKRDVGGGEYRPKQDKEMQGESQC